MTLRKSCFSATSAASRSVAAVTRVYKNQEQHDPTNLNRAREIASILDPIPVGILYRNPDVPCYEDLRNTGQMRSTAMIRAGLEAEFDKFTVWPQGSSERPLPAA